MAKGEHFFAWIDPGETVFGPEHMRRDENVFAFTLAHDEGEFATLSLDIRRPQNAEGDTIGLLTPARKQWAWFAFDCGPALKKFRGRLVGIPSSIFREVVTLEFVARPIDYVEQKDALAESLRVLPGYDPVFVDAEAREDPDQVLEGYSAIWHIDAETHVVSASDEITGEDGLVELQPEDMLYDGFDCKISGSPLTTVNVDATLTWTQGGTGNVDLTDYLIDNWPTGFTGDPDIGALNSFTLTASSFPKVGGKLGAGWTATTANARDRYNLATRQLRESGGIIIKWSPDESTKITFTNEKDIMDVPPGSVPLSRIQTGGSHKVSYSDGIATSISDSSSYSSGVVPMHYTEIELVAGYEAARPFTEQVHITLIGDVQPVVTLPGDDEALDIKLTTANLSEGIGGTGGEIPIGDPRRRSYICTPRGEQSLQHLIARARAHLLKRARVVELTVEPMLARMPDITLRKSALVHDNRLPGGQAFGKITNYGLALDGDNGAIKCSAVVACPVGRGGEAVAVEGEPIYVDADYIGPDQDWQEYTGRTVLFDTSVGYSPPLFAPNDDGIDFFGSMPVGSVIEQPLAVEHPPIEQRDAILQAGLAWAGFQVAIPPPNVGLGDGPTAEELAQQAVQNRATAITDALKQVETKATFSLKSMEAKFTSEYEITVTDLNVPSGIDLEAAP